MPTSTRTMSGGIESSRAMAWSPSLTATTSMSSSANVSAMTRWIVTLSSARRRVCGTLGLYRTNGTRGLGGSGSNTGICVDEVDDFPHGRARQEDPLDAHLVKFRDIHVGDDAPYHHQHVVEPPGGQQFHDPGRDVIMRPRQDRQADDVGIFLQGRCHDLLGSLAKAGINDFHSGIP